MEQVDAQKRVASAMVNSGYFKDAGDVAQAFVKIQAGQELGLPPVASMTGVHIVKGKPTLGANLIAALIKNDPRYNYRVLELTDAVCRIQFYEDGEECGVSEFTAEDANKAGTQNMHKFPRNMLFARAISNGAKWYTPGIFGGVTVYTPEELGADEDGNIIEAEIFEPEPEYEKPDDYEPERENAMQEQLPPPPPEPQTNGKQAPEPDANLIADIRASIEGMAQDGKVSLGTLNGKLAQTGLYNETTHAHNSVKKWPEWPDGKNDWSVESLNGGTKVDLDKALAIFDWCVERKRETA